MTTHGVRGDGYLGDERVGLSSGPPRRPAHPPTPVRPRAVAARPASEGSIQGVVSNARKDSQPYGQNANWQIVTFELERRDERGGPIDRVAVELRATSLTGPIPADGAIVRAYGRFGRDGVFRADRVVNARTGHTLKSRGRRAIRVLQWAVGLFVVAILGVVVTGFVTGGEVFDKIGRSGGGGGAPQPKTVTVPKLAGMNQSEAVAALEDAGITGFDYRIVQKNSRSVDFGFVIGTEPAAGSKVEVNGRTAKVTVNISIGPR